MKPIRLLLVLSVAVFGVACGPASAWSGTWNTMSGGAALTMKLTGIGSSVSGTYNLSSGTINGTVSGTHLTGKWAQSSSSVAGCAGGDIDFMLASDGKSFTGQWWYCGQTDGKGGGTWTGKKQ